METRRPQFSVIVPTYGRPEQVGRCLENLTAQDFPTEDFEVIVVDDGSPSAGLDASVAPFRERLQLSLKRQEHAGPAAARNAGAALARGRFLAFTDDDCAPAPHWLPRLAARFAVTPGRLIGGRIVNGLPANLCSTASQLLIDYLYEYYNADPDRARFLSSNNLAMAAERYHDVGGFDSGFPRAAGEDRDFCDRWLTRGFRMSYAPEVIVYHSHALGLGAFAAQHFRYGQGAYCFHSARSRRGQGPVQVEPFAFYWSLMRYPLAHGRRGLASAALLVVAQAANAAGFFWERLRQASASTKAS